MLIDFIQFGEGQMPFGFRLPQGIGPSPPGFVKDYWVSM